MVEKRINFLFCLGTANDVSSMESVEISKSFSLVGKVCLSKIFLSLNLSFELWHLYKSLLPSTKGLSFNYAIFIFEFESQCSLIKHQLRGTMIVFEHWV